MKEKNPGRGNHVSKGKPENLDMIDHEREKGKGTEVIETKQKRGSETGQEKERSQRKLIEEVEAEIVHLTDERAESQDTRKIVLPRLVHDIPSKELCHCSCVLKKLIAKLFKIVIFNPFKSSPSSATLLPFCFRINPLVFFFLSKPLFLGFPTL